MLRFVPAISTSSPVLVATVGLAVELSSPILVSVLVEFPPDSVVLVLFTVVSEGFTVDPVSVELSVEETDLDTRFEPTGNKTGDDLAPPAEPTNVLFVSSGV
jgi:hypothetical protein